MKKILSFVCVLFAFSMIVNAGPMDKIIPFEQLPEISRNFVTTHFADVTVAYASKGLLGYEVRLNNGSEIEFDKQGKWIEIDCEHSAIPASVLNFIPAAITQYIEGAYPVASVVKLKAKTFGGYEIELDNDLEMEFSKDGRLVKLDD